MTKLSLPTKTKKLVSQYLSLKIGDQKISCPYYQNVWEKTRPLVFSGKGTPREIEYKIKKLLRLKPQFENISPGLCKFYLVMANLGVDCSGFVVNVLDQYFKETEKISFLKTISLKELPLRNWPTFLLRPRASLSANWLTSAPISDPVEIKDVRPADLIKIGKTHIAIVSSIWLENQKIKKIEYFHSTSDYLDENGVRSGTIIIKDDRLPLEKQIWKENLQGRNWTKEDYLAAKKDDRGLRRLRYLLRN